jgi:hypothetical protein
MTANRGWTAASSSGIVEVALPWWATLREIGLRAFPGNLLFGFLLCVSLK